MTIATLERSPATTNHIKDIVAARRHESAERFAVIGGGMLGLTLAYRLSQRGFKVELFDAADAVGGVTRAIEINGIRIDPFYHTILNSDANLLALIDELGLSDKTYFHRTSNGFYADGKTYPINSPLDLLRFKPLTLWERFRLGFGTQLCHMHRDWQKLHYQSVSEYLTKWCGKGGFQKFWRHLLRCKYDGSFDDVPATAIWARIVRMAKQDQKKLDWVKLGYLTGGYQTIIDRLVAGIKANGGQVHTSAPVKQLVIEQNRVKGVVTPDGERAFDYVCSTVGYPILSRLLPSGYDTLKRRWDQQKYFGSICLLLMMKKRLSKHHTTYLLDDSIPFTGVVETTHYIDPKEVGNQHLVYLSKYFKHDSQYADLPRWQVEEEFLEHFLRMYPHVAREDITRVVFAREKFVDPVRTTTAESLPPGIHDAKIEGLFLTNNYQIYPRLPCGESVVEYAGEALEEILAACRSQESGVRSQ